MKKGLLGLSAFIFAAALVGCGADKEKNADNKDKAETTTVAEETSAAKNDAEDSGKEDTTSKKDEKTADPVSIKDIAGAYHKTGHAYMGDYPDDMKNIDDQLKEDPITVSEDGTLHFCGKDYKLNEEGVKEEANIFSIEGSGFDTSKYMGVFSCKADKDYEGPCAFIKTTTHMKINGEDCPYDTYMLLLKQSGTEDTYGYISLDTGEASEDSWSFDWDDEDESDEVSESEV